MIFSFKLQTMLMYFRSWNPHLQTCWIVVIQHERHTELAHLVWMQQPAAQRWPRSRKSVEKEAEKQSHDRDAAARGLDNGRVTTEGERAEMWTRNGRVPAEWWLRDGRDLAKRSASPRNGQEYNMTKKRLKQTVTAEHDGRESREKAEMRLKSSGREPKLPEIWPSGGR